MAHTILMIQAGDKPETRTYADFDTVDGCMEGICKIYEEHLKKLHRHSGSITYDMSQLFEFIDNLSDLSCLVFQERTLTYKPNNKDMIKEKLYIFLSNQAQQR